MGVTTFFSQANKLQEIPHLRNFTTTDPTTAIVGLCMCKRVIFALVEDPLQSHIRTFLGTYICFKFENPHVRWTEPDLNLAHLLALGS